MGKKGFLNPRAVSGVIAAVFFFTGFLFVDRGSISGNAIITGNAAAFNPVSFVGLLLIFVAMILGFYSIRRK
jgi:hypothetical protein